MARQRVQLFISLHLLVQLATFCNCNDSLNGGIVDSSSINLEQKDNYCLRNVTYYEERGVDKTRQVEIKPTGYWKWFKKSKTQVEHYTETVRVPHTRLQNDCCEGYAMVANKTCQPVCEPGCPANAFCRTPQRCQCRFGYEAVKSAVNGTHHCMPRCSSGCPYGGKCVAPELCECAPGYQAGAGSCAPTCASDCLDGRCTALNKCTCNEGYAKVLASGECVALADCVPGLDCEEETEVSGVDETTTDEITATAADTTEMHVAFTRQDGIPVSSESQEENENIVLFPSDEEATNCTLQPCIGDTDCKLAGRCTCADGFIRHQPAPVNGVEVGPICKALMEQSEIVDDHDTEGSWGLTFFVVVGSALMVCAFAALLVKLWLHKRGSMNVVGKNEACCKFEKNSTSSDSGHVDMC
ncbi:uncharacterized protein LOC101452980 [Ceratitis capitata]|uniref:(Mediterranean fruit fly) hypothetical protein n=1 Tax=Ceratitis capitata TaxID=7213 RepID=W8CDL4_CERCA|nr:uncharacterized protein LOC101452980 [Ceratitis capitata]CAD6997425.1 unnamed protein product [Ceratitis capitata]